VKIDSFSNFDYSQNQKTEEKKQKNAQLQKQILKQADMHSQQRIKQRQIAQLAAMVTGVGGNINFTA
jgi:hypothetical protein